MYLRYGYAEIFYHAGIGITVTLIAAGLILLAYAEYAKKIQFLNTMFASLGKAVLGLYILHLIIISYIIKPIFEKIDDLSIFICIGLAHIAIIFVFALLLNRFKEAHNKLPTLFYWIFGK
jgi:fucose 4-O-acetylase-like acetyltransferase